jgi:outer membrane protein assembly factor BamE (lipoprotein component of BamABCDE complex)
MRAPVGLACALSVLACGFHHGSNITPEQRAALAAGTTTRDEVVGSWGNPSLTIEKPDGTATLVYARFFHQPAIGGSHTDREDVVLKFGADGRLVEWSEAKYKIK